MQCLSGAPKGNHTDTDCFLKLVMAESYSNNQDGHCVLSNTSAETITVYPAINQTLSSTLVNPLCQSRVVNLWANYKKYWLKSSTVAQTWDWTRASRG